jgi:integrase
VVMDVLGHSQLSITMDLYSHVMPSALRDAADAMDRALNADSCAGYYPWFDLG